MPSFPRSRESPGGYAPCVQRLPGGVLGLFVLGLSRACRAGAGEGDPPGQDRCLPAWGWEREAA